MFQVSFLFRNSKQNFRLIEKIVSKFASQSESEKKSSLKEVFEMSLEGQLAEYVNSIIEGNFMKDNDQKKLRIGKVVTSSKHFDYFFVSIEFKGSSKGTSNSNGNNNGNAFIMKINTNTASTPSSNPTKKQANTIYSNSNNTTFMTQSALINDFILIEKFNTSVLLVATSDNQLNSYTISQTSNSRFYSTHRLPDQSFNIPSQIIKLIEGEAFTIALLRNNILFCYNDFMKTPMFELNLSIEGSNEFKLLAADSIESNRDLQLINSSSAFILTSKSLVRADFSNFSEFDSKAGITNCIFNNEEVSEREDGIGNAVSAFRVAVIDDSKHSILCAFEDGTVRLFESLRQGFLELLSVVVCGSNISLSGRSIVKSLMFSTVVTENGVYPCLSNFFVFNSQGEMLIFELGNEKVVSKTPKKVVKLSEGSKIFTMFDVANDYSQMILSCSDSKIKFHRFLLRDKSFQQDKMKKINLGILSKLN